eukprot:jgi/Botrbrau1/19041/Bobra.0100s0068.2
MDLGALELEMPPLPRFPIRSSYMAGPTFWSNWVVKDRVLAGAFPGSVCDDDTDQLLVRLLRLGINVFVCLQLEVDLNTQESQWRNGTSLRPYFQDLKKILQTGRVRNARRAEFIHLPIEDGGVAPDDSMDMLANMCLQRIKDGDKLYIHCWGGHGRTGTLVALLLARLYRLTPESALRYTQALHDCRRDPQRVASPTTSVQLQQVKRILARKPSGNSNALGRAAGSVQAQPSTSSLVGRFSLVPTTVAISADDPATSPTDGQEGRATPALRPQNQEEKNDGQRDFLLAAVKAGDSHAPSTRAPSVTSPFSAPERWGPPLATVWTSTGLKQPIVVKGILPNLSSLQKSVSSALSISQQMRVTEAGSGQQCKTLDSY